MYFKQIGGYLFEVKYNVAVHVGVECLCDNFAMLPFFKLEEQREHVLILLELAPLHVHNM